MPITKKTLIILIIGIILIFMVGCSNQDEMPSRPPITEPPMVGGGCGVASSDIIQPESTPENIRF